jgi:hypothetical protein
MGVLLASRAVFPLMLCCAGTLLRTPIADTPFVMSCCDVLLPIRWQARYESAAEGIKPSSDTPLLYHALDPQAAQQYGWSESPNIALHGHALADEWGKRLCERKHLQPYVTQTQTGHA